MSVWKFEVFHDLEDVFIGELSVLAEESRQCVYGLLVNFDVVYPIKSFACKVCSTSFLYEPRISNMNPNVSGNLIVNKFNEVLFSVPNILWVVL